MQLGFRRFLDTQKTSGRNRCAVMLKINSRSRAKTTGLIFTKQMHNILEYIPLKFGDDSRRCVTMNMMKIFFFQKLSIKDGVIDFGAQ